MKKIAVFGGSGGLGIKLIPLLKEKYEVISLSSKTVDIIDFYQVNKFFEENDVDIVLNMAAKKYDKYLSEINENDYLPIIEMLDVNIMGMINILAACLPKMIDKKWGRIIAMSSVLAEQNIPKASLYSASKAFIDRLISSANKENNKFGITCNSIQLGYWDGGMCDDLDSNFKNKIKDNIGLGRFGKIEELFKTIDFIINNEYVCGSKLRIDGGM